MSDSERGDARAQGALHNWLAGLKGEMENFRSPEYAEQFWKSLQAEMKYYVDGKAY